MEPETPAVERPCSIVFPLLSPLEYLSSNLVVALLELNDGEERIRRNLNIFVHKGTSIIDNAMRIHSEVRIMKLAEALILRADCQKRIAQLKSRLLTNAKVQEGDAPAEPPQELSRPEVACALSISRRQRYISTDV